MGMGLQTQALRSVPGRGDWDRLTNMGGYGEESSQGPQDGPPRDLSSVHMGNPGGGLLGSKFGGMVSAQPGGAPPGGPQPGGADKYKMSLLKGALKNFAPTDAPPMQQGPGPMNAPRPQFG